MSTHQTKLGFVRATRLREAETEADATQFCEGCEGWTSHEMNDDGSYTCRRCE